MERITATLAALSLAHWSLAAAAPAFTADAPGWFSTELEAVVAAARAYNQRSIREDREFLGAILRDGECFTYTVGAGQRGHDRITVGIAVPPDAEIVAFWHTHGGRRHSHRFFSDVDTRLVEQWQKRLYLADYTGALKVMAPGAPTLSRARARHLGLPEQSGYARGRRVNDASGNPIKIARRTRPTG